MVHKTWQISKATVVKFYHDDPFIYSAAIAFFAIFSLPAILIIIVNSTGALFGKGVIKGRLVGQISQFAGEAAAKQAEQIIENISFSDASTFSTLVSIAAVLISATFIFGTIQKALNAMWEVKSRPDRFFLRILINRLTSLALVMVMSTLMLVSFLIQTGLLLLHDVIAKNSSNLPSYTYRVATEVFFLGLTTVLFAMLFKLLPDVKIKWRDVWMGALVTAVLFAIGKYVINLYLVQSNLATTYGAAGAVVIILVWIYYSSLILLFGAEFTQVYTLQQGRKIWPDDHAVKVTVQEVQLGHRK